MNYSLTSLAAIRLLSYLGTKKSYSHKLTVKYGFEKIIRAYFAYIFIYNSFAKIFLLPL